MRLVETRVSTPLFIIISIEIWILGSIVTNRSTRKSSKSNKEAMPMLKRRMKTVGKYIEAIGVNMISGVILA